MGVRKERSKGNRYGRNRTQPVLTYFYGSKQNRNHKKASEFSKPIGIPGVCF